MVRARVAVTRTYVHRGYVDVEMPEETKATPAVIRKAEQIAKDRIGDTDLNEHIEVEGHDTTEYQETLEQRQ